MKHRHAFLRRLLVAALLLASLATARSGKSVERTPLAFASLLGDHLVLQRDKPVPVWGQGAEADEITVTGLSRCSTR